MRGIKVTFLFLGAIYGLVIPGFTQYNTSIGKVTISSPNAASLGKFGDIPVSYHTGIPDIEIPIYTIKSGPLELPVSLSNHASGVKVQEQASWVGSGWCLNAGGVITRTVVGAPDDRGLYNLYTTKGHFSDYGYNSFLFSAGPANCSSTPYVCPVGRSGMTPGNYAPQDSYLQTGIFDGEPDLFFFNFNGHSGKFYFNDDRTPIIVPEQDLKIVPIYTGSDWRGFSGFIITTPDGVQYFFGQNPNTDGNIDATEITYNVTTQSSYTGQGASSSWFLNKIVSADSLFSINLIYQAESYSYYTLSMYPIPSVRNPNIFAYNLEYDLDKNFINGVRLSKIVFANGEVDFNPGSLRQDLSLGVQYNGIDDQPNNSGSLGGRTLGSITINTGNVCKKDSFYFGYFYDNSPLTGSLFTTTYPNLNLQSDQYRLRLDSIQEISCDGSLKIPPYKFSYFSGTVPRKLSFGIDHWGFYNGVTSNTGLIPTYLIIPAAGQAAPITTVAGADRDTHWPACLAGTLQQIAYPTGGNSSFVFESNDIYSSSTSYTTAGLANLVLAQFGQEETSDYQTFTSNGNPISVSITNNYTYTTNLVITNSSGTVYSTEVGNNSSYQTTIALAAGTYTATLTIPTYQQSSGGVQASLTQPAAITTLSNTPIGGLRIKSITNSDAITSQNVVTSYRYTFNNVANGQSSGILFSIPVYVQALRNDAWAIVNGASCSSTGCFTCYGSNASYYQSPSSIRPMTTTQGNHIGYGEVYVSQTGNGYTEHRYYSNNGAIPQVSDPPLTDVCVRTLGTFCDPSLPNSPAPPVPFDPMRGEHAFEGYFTESGQLLKSQTYIPLFQFDSLITPGIMSRTFITGYESAASGTDPLSVDPLNNVPIDGEVPVGISTITEYTLQSAKKIRDSTITQTYDQLSGSYLTDINTVYYGSRYHHQPTQMLSYTSKGEKLVTNLKNAFDLRISNFSVSDQLNTYYTNVNSDNSYLGSAIDGVTTSPSDPNYYFQRLNIYTNYRYMKAVDRQTYIAFRRQNFTDPGNTYTADHNSAKAAADAELMPVLELQDEFRPLVIEQSKWRNSSLVQAEFTHYDYTSNPANFVYPNKSQFIDLQVPSTSFSDAAVSGNSLQKDSRYTNEVAYNYYLGNPQQVTPHNGITTSYIWDYLNTEPIAKVVNTTADQIAYTSFEADGTGNWTIGTGTVDTTGGITGRNSYNLTGTISKTGLNASTTYIVSYWTENTSGTKNTSSFSIAGTISGYPVIGKTITINNTNWTLYIHKVTGQSTIALSGGSGPIDELRLYPATAQMTTYTYVPLVGMTSQTDVGNRVTYYEYDGLARLKRIRDQDYNILKTYEYQYQATGGCGSGCYILGMQTLAGTGTLSYPVGVFDVHGNLVGNAAGQSAYVSLWNSDTADTRIGTLAAGPDSMHFDIRLNAGQAVLAGVMGCRYYQYDFSSNQLSVSNANAAYIDFGDGTKISLTSSATTHSYPDSSIRTITLYHNDASNESPTLADGSNNVPFTYYLNNLRGNLPQYMQALNFNSYINLGALSTAGISNWSTITSINTLQIVGEGNLYPCQNLNFSQDFMNNNTQLQTISFYGTPLNVHSPGFLDSTFKISRLKNDWNTYFKNLSSLTLTDYQWNREDLSGLANLTYFVLVADNQQHNNNLNNNPAIPLPTSVIDNVLIQIAAGAGSVHNNGFIFLTTGGTNRTSTSDVAYNLLISNGWSIFIDTTTQ